MLKFESVYKSFKTDFWSPNITVLEDLSFNVPKGKIVGFLGANGAGKTTSLKILMNFVPLNSGRVSFSSELGSSRSEIFSNLGYLPERPYFYPHLTGRDFLYYMGRLSGRPMSSLKEQAKKWGEVLSIGYAYDRKIKTYSKGMLQRLGFVSALIHQPQLIILDEPLAGLDPVGRKEFKDTIVNLNKEGVTIFFSSHIVSDVEAICEKVVLLEGGKCVYEGNIDSLIDEHVKPNYFVKYIGESKVVEEVVSIEEKDSKIQKLISDGVNIVEVQRDKPTLEEIVYRLER